MYGHHEAYGGELQAFRASVMLDAASRRGHEEARGGAQHVPFGVRRPELPQRQLRRGFGVADDRRALDVCSWRRYCTCVVPLYERFRAPFHATE